MKHFFREIIGTIVLAVIIFALLQTTFQTFIVVGCSMEPSFQWAQRVLTNKISYKFHEPERGDVVVRSLLPLAVKHGSGVLLPFIYGIGTAIPVVIFSIVLAFGARWLGKMFERVTQVERWLRTVTGIVFIGVGIYMSLVHVYRVL